LIRPSEIIFWTISRISSIWILAFIAAKTPFPFGDEHFRAPRAGVFLLLAFPFFPVFTVFGLTLGRACFCGTMPNELGGTDNANLV
jgi:hypothetical protein